MGLFGEDDPEVVKFFGMKFKCDQEYFIKAIQEEYEDLLVIFYLTTWITVKSLLFIGLFPLLDRSRLIALAIKERWNSRVNAVAMHGINQYAWYVLF